MTRNLPINARPQQRKPVLRIIGRILLGLLALIVLLILGLLLAARLTLSGVQSAPVEAAPLSFDGSYLLGISDADMIGTAYADGILKQIPGVRDTLTLVPLPLTSANAEKQEVIVSNSVTAWPQNIATSPDGRYVYVVEVASEVEDSVESVPSTDDIPAGRYLTVVDTTTSQVVQQIDVGIKPITIGSSQDGRFLAIGSIDEGRQLAILPTESLDDSSTFSYLSIEADGQGSGEVPSVAWHPSGRFLALNLNTKGVQFYEVLRADNGSFEVRPHGDLVARGNTITEGLFTPDGRHYITAEINWNTLPGPLGNLFNPPGQLIVTRFDDSEAAQHVETARVNVGNSPEGITLSQDGSLIATVNMRRTYLPDGLAFWQGANLNSISLASFNNETGEVTLHGEYGFEGVLPEDAVFDADGDSLAVTIYNYREDLPQTGAIEFWNVVRDPEPRLVRTDVNVEVVRGVHNLFLIP